MMAKEFLERVLPAGLIVIAKPKGKGFQHYVCENVDQAAKQALAIDNAGEEDYFGMKIDPMRTADASSILRVVGTHNRKREVPRPVALIRDAGPYTPREMKEAIDNLSTSFNVDLPTNIPAPTALLDTLPSNTEK